MLSRDGAGQSALSVLLSALTPLVGRQAEHPACKHLQRSYPHGFSMVPMILYGGPDVTRLTWSNSVKNDGCTKTELERQREYRPAA